MFASIESIRTLLREHDLERRIAHSDAWRKIAPRRNRVLPPAPQPTRRGIDP